MDTAHDQSMTGNDNNHEHRLPVSLEEQRALDLYDKLQELRLEIAIINAQQRHQASEHESQEELTAEEAAELRSDLLETRARYLLREQVVDSVLAANPILKAVHNGTEASPVERDLLPHIQQRDEVAISVAGMAASTGDVRDQATRVQSEALRAARQNMGLAAEVMSLVAQVRDARSPAVNNERTQQEIKSLEDELKTKRQRWRVVKGTTSGVIAGSGVDWARDDALRDLVLDPEDDE